MPRQEAKTSIDFQQLTFDILQLAVKSQKSKVTSHIMAKDLNPKCKQCRRAGEKLFLKGDRCGTVKCAMIKRNYPPGFHGPKGKKRVSDFGLQLSEKQKAKKQYNIFEKQFRLTFDKAKSQKGNTGDNFLKLLEFRFDNVVFRSGFAKSRSQARQMITHNLFTVNNKRVNIPSYRVAIGDVVSIKPNKKKAKIFNDIADKLAKVETPGWVNVDKKGLTAKILHAPTAKEIMPNFNLQMIIEFYSK
jgi:small subunit ribosomal protein S4